MLEIRNLKASVDGKEILKGIKEARSVYLSYQTEVLNLAKAGKKETAVDLMLTKLREAQTAYIDSINKLIQYQNSLVEEGGKKAENQYDLFEFFVEANKGLPRATLLQRLGRPVDLDPQVSDADLLAEYCEALVGAVPDPAKKSA